MYHFFLLFHCVNILAGPASQERTRIFPTRQEGSFSRITCVALTDDFLYYGTEAGTVEVFFIGEFVLLAGTVLPCSALFCFPSFVCLFLDLVVLIVDLLISQRYSCLIMFHSILLHFILLPFSDTVR